MYLKFSCIQGKEGTGNSAAEMCAHPVSDNLEKFFKIHKICLEVILQYLHISNYFSSIILIHDCEQLLFLVFGHCL